MTNIHARKRAVPPSVKQAVQRTAPTPPKRKAPSVKQPVQPVTASVDINKLPKHEIIQHALYMRYQVIPKDCIFVDPVNGVVLYKNQESGGWCSVAERILGQYTDKEVTIEMHETKTLNAWIRELGFVWVEGREQMTKGAMNAQGAQQVINQLLSEGAIYYAGR